MMRNTGFLCVALLCSLLLLSAALADEAPRYKIVRFSNGVTDFEAIQLARYAPDDSNWLASGAYYAMLEGNYEFGENIFYPHEPAGALPVDCNATEMLGVYYMIKRTKKHQYRKNRLDIRFVWRHSLYPEYEMNDYNRVYWYRKGQSNIKRGEAIHLTEPIRINGVISVEASIGSDVIFRNSFELTGCPEQPPEPAATP